MSGSNPGAASSDDDEFELPAWSRTYCGFRQRFVEPYAMQLSELATLSLRQAPCVSAEHAKEAKATSDGSCTASTVWDAGIVLGAHTYERGVRALAENGPKQSCVLDLGAGTGIVGLAAAASGAHLRVVLTDLPSVLPLLEQNVAQNRDALGETELFVTSLRWDDDRELREAARRFGPFDLIVGGDLLYRPQVVTPLLTALGALAGVETTVLLAASLSHSPETIRLFSKRAEESGFVVERLDASAHAEEFTSEEVRMLRLTRAQSQSGAMSRTKKQPAASLSDEEPAGSAKRARIATEGRE